MIDIILYVADQQRSKEFYKKVLNKEPIQDVPGMTEFMLSGQCILGLMPESRIAQILGDKMPHPSTGSGIPRCELYLYSKDVDTYCERLSAAGAKEISPAEKRSWGDKVAYFADPDGHIIAIAQKINT